MESTHQSLCIFYCDMVDSTSLSVVARREGKEESHYTLKNSYLAYWKQILEAQRGIFVDSAGDSLLVRFDDYLDAVHASVEAQLKTLAMPEFEACRMRVGLHLGMVEVVESGRIQGADVNLGSRVCSMASAGEIWLSESCAGAVRHYLPADWQLEPCGERILKGSAAPVPLFCVVAPGLPRRADESLALSGGLSVSALPDETSPWSRWFTHGLNGDSQSALIERGALVVPNGFVEGAKRGEADVLKIVHGLQRDDRILIINGLPGSGKSVAAFEAIHRSGWSSRPGMVFDVREFCDGPQNSLEEHRAEKTWKDVYDRLESETLQQGIHLPGLIVVENAELMLDAGGDFQPAFFKTFFEETLFHTHYRLLLLCAVPGLPHPPARSAGVQRIVIQPYSSEDAGDLWQHLAGDVSEVALSEQDVRYFFSPAVMSGTGNPKEVRTLWDLARAYPEDDLLQNIRQRRQDALRALLFRRGVKVAMWWGEKTYSLMDKNAKKLVWLLYCLRLPRSLETVAYIWTDYVFPEDTGTQSEDEIKANIEAIANRYNNTISTFTSYSWTHTTTGAIQSEQKSIGLHLLVSSWLAEQRRTQQDGGLVTEIGKDLDTIYRGIADYFFYQIDDFLFRINTSNADTLIAFYDLEQPWFSGIVYSWLHALAQTPRTNDAAQQEEDAALVALYLTGHYWWDVYVTGFPLCKPLLEACRRMETLTDTAASVQENTILNALETIQYRWPQESLWTQIVPRTSEDRRKLATCRDKMKLLYPMLGLDQTIEALLPTQKRDDLIPAYRLIAKGLVAAYIAMSESYLGDAEAETWLRSTHDTIRRLRTLRWTIPFFDGTIADWYLRCRKDVAAAAYWVLRALEGLEFDEQPYHADQRAAIGDCVTMGGFFYGAEYFNARERYLEVSHPSKNYSPPDSPLSDRRKNEAWRWCEPCAESEAYYVAAEMFQKTGETEYEFKSLMAGFFHGYEYCCAPHPPDEYTVRCAAEGSERLAAFVLRMRAADPAQAQRFEKQVEEFWAGAPETGPSPTIDTWPLQRDASAHGRMQSELEIIARLLPALPSREYLLTREWTEEVVSEVFEQKLQRSGEIATQIRLATEKREGEIAALKQEVKSRLRELARDVPESARWRTFPVGYHPEEHFD